jgi:hypothetical protein
MKKLALLPLLLLTLNSHAAEREWVTYKQLVETLRLDKFYAIPAAERDKINLFVTIKPKNHSIKPADMVLTVIDGAERHPLTPLSPEYRMTVVPNPKWLAADLKIMTSLPKEEKSTPGWDTTAVLPEGQQWRYAQVMGSVPQLESAIKKMAGAFSMFAPSVKAVTFKFKEPAQMKIDARDGTKSYSTDAKNQITLKPDSSLMKENPPMSVSARPFEAELEGD